MKNDWLSLAKGLKLGERRKIKHCGGSPSMSISSTLRGWQGYCHRCSEKFWEARQSLISHEELEEYRNSSSVTKCPQLPSDFATEYVESELTSSLWMNWLLRGGIGESLRKQYQLGWTKRYGKAVLPICTSARSKPASSPSTSPLTSSTHSTPSSSKPQELEGMLLRRLGSTGPKYLLDHVSPEVAVFLSSGASTGNAVTNCPVDCVITEDVLSAIRVGQFVQSAALLGTSLGQGKLDRVISSTRKPSPVIGLWGDPDKAGQMLNRKMERSLTLQGLRVVWLTSPKDPKNMRDYDIKEILSDRYHSAQDH